MNLFKLHYCMIKRFLFFAILFSLTCCCPHHYVPTDPDPPVSFYVPKRIRVALVLGSGGVRGMAHVGVLEELVSAGIPIDLIVGCSAGSIVGALYAANPDVDALIKAVWGMRSHNLLDIDLLHCRYGLSQGHSMTHMLDTCLEATTFDELKIPLVVVATDLNSGELVPIGHGDLVKAVQASCSIPFAFVPCEHMGRIFVDGGVIDPVPVRVAKELGAEIIISVDLCELLPKTFPTNLFQVASRSAEIAFMWQNQYSCYNADVIIRPKTCGVGTFNDKMKRLLYVSGQNAAREKIIQIKGLLSQLEEMDPNDIGQERLVNLGCYTPQIYFDLQ